MKKPPPNLPILYVEGNDDISAINALLLRHGIDTRRGEEILFIQASGDVKRVLDEMPNAIKTSSDRPVGFVVDIDILVTDRWNAVKNQLTNLGLSPPKECPAQGYFDKLPDYPHPFGVWLMPDCQTDNIKLENLVETLLPDNDPLWPHAKESVSKAEKLVNDANAHITDPKEHWIRFTDVDRIKAEVHTWLAWQREPGAQLGAAINDRVLRHDSPEALNFLDWIKKLYGLH